MSHDIAWIRETLLKNYPQMDQDGGIDLNQNGTIEENEIADKNHNHCVSEEEAYDFYVNNRSILDGRIDYLRWGGGLSPDNPIHELIYLESVLVPASEIETTYRFLTDIISDVRDSLASIHESEDVSPFRKMARVYLILQEHNISFDTQIGISSHGLLTENISRRELDCDTATFILLAAAHEFNWPVYAISVPDHMAARWDEGDGEHTDFETRDGMPTNDYLYMNQFHVTQEQVEDGIFLRNLTPSELSGFFYMNRGITYSITGRLEEARADLDRAVDLAALNPMTYFNRAVNYHRLGNLEEALADYNRTIELWPNDHMNYYSRGVIKMKLGKYEEALEDLNRSLELRPENANVIFLHGVANVELGNREEAERDFERAAILWPRLREITYQQGDGIDTIYEIYMSNSEANGYLRRAMDKIETGDLQGALTDLNRAIELDPCDVLSYNNRGVVRAQLGQHEEAMADFEYAIQLYPQDAMSYYNIALLKAKLGEYQTALENAQRALELDPENEMIRTLVNRLTRDVEL